MKERNPRMIRKLTQEQPTNICMRDLQNTRVAHDARVTHKESHAYTKNDFLRYFWAFSDFGVFWKILANRNIFLMVEKCSQTDLQNSIYRSSKLGIFQWLFMKCHHGSVDMRRNHGKVVTARDVSFWDITLILTWMNIMMTHMAYKSILKVKIWNRFTYT